jgi:4,5-dihydroxyphthalate decarboxylase
MSSRLCLSFACWNYDRTRALVDGRVKPDGIDLVCLEQVVEETFFRMARFREFDVAEMSLSSYSISLGREAPPFVAIPVFPSRMFRHSGIFVSARSGITAPKDLVGKKVGVPEYQLTAPVWMRGILQDEYAVDPSSLTYFTGGQEEPGRDEKIALDLPPQFKVQPIGPDRTLSQMLADGEIDALFAPRIPSTYRTRPGSVRRLFVDFAAVEKAYFKKTGIFPIMHTVAIKREVYERDRWIAQTLVKAFEAAQRLAYEDLDATAAIKTMLPWQIAAVEETRELMGENWWSYGLQPNYHVLDTFLRYHHEQGLSKRRLKPEELFAAETLQGSFKV